MPIKINGATSGSTTIAAPATGGDETIELSTALASKPTKTTASSAPSSPTTGDIWFDTTTSPATPKFWDGSAFQNVSPGGGLTLISTTTLSGNAVTISGIPGTYTNLLLILDAYTVSGNASVYFRINGDSSANAHQRQMNWLQNGTGQSAAGQATEVYFSFGSVASGSNANVFALDVYNYASSTARKSFRVTGAFRNSASAQEAFDGWGNWNSATAVTSLEITAVGNTWSGGSAKLYGVK